MKKRTKLKDIFGSLKFHLIFIVLVIVIAPGFILGRVLVSRYESRAISYRTSEISTQATVLADQIGAAEYLPDGKTLPSNLQTQLNMLSNLYDGRILVVDDIYNIVYDSYNLDYRHTIISKEVLQTASDGTMQSYYDKTNHYIEMTIPITNPDENDGTVDGVMLVAVSTDNVSATITDLNATAAVACSISAIVFGFFGILFVVLSMRPFKRISNDIEKIKNGYSGEKLTVNDYTETFRICDKFNEMIARMKVMDDSREEFVSNVSHELKTPLTSIKVLADSINSMPEAPLEMYQEFMGDITSEIDRENQIISDLLSLVKMDKTSSDLNVSNLNINELVEQIIKRLQPIADRQKVALVLESFRPIMADVDEVKITLAISNLIENAIKYNRNDGGGWVHISLNSDHQYFYLKVEDSGMGIPEESLDHIFERFYRVDKSHSREIGGTGLGLAITRSSILMHRGAIKVYSTLGEGTTFDVRVPLNYIS